MNRAEDKITRWRRRSNKISINTAIARRAFGDFARMELNILIFINDYNINMNSIDLANQYRETYDI